MTCSEGAKERAECSKHYSVVELPYPIELLLLNGALLKRAGPLMEMIGPLGDRCLPYKLFVDYARWFVISAIDTVGLKNDH